MASEGLQDILRFVQQENVRLKQENQTLTWENQQMHQMLRGLRTLQEVSIGVNVRTDVVYLMDRILGSALQSVGSCCGSLLLMDEETGELEFVVAHGVVGPSLIGYRLAVGEGVAGWVAQHQQPVLLDDVRRDPRFSAGVDETFAFNTRSMLCVPVIYGERVLGVIQALNKNNGDAFTEADLTLFGVVAQLAAAAMTNMTQMLETAVSA